MKTKLLVQLVLISCLAVCSLSAQKPPKPQISANPVDADSLSIYREFLKSYENGSPAHLNISELTEPLDADESDRKGCLREFPSLEFKSKTVHRFSADAFAPPNKLVDPATHKISDPWTGIKRGQSVDSAVDQGFAAALFTFSEILFDSSHTHAAFSYSLVCGSLCGNGAILIYEKKNGVWKQAKSRCSEWIS